MNMNMEFPFALPPEIGETTPVAEGILWLRMALPFALDHINLWLLADGDQWVAVDTGVDTPETRDAWTKILDGKTLSQLICTHFHPDHMGLAGWLTTDRSVPLCTTLGEWSFARMLSLENGEDYVANQVEHYRRAGLEGSELEGVRARTGSFRNRVAPLPTAISTLKDGQILSIGGQNWQVVVGSGHSPEHACLWCEEKGILIAGDQILPRISPIVGVWPQQPDADPLADFLASLNRLKALPADTLVLPSHGLPFRGLHDRANALIGHHEERVAQLRSARLPATAVKLTKALFSRDLDPQNMGFAIGETLAHANHLISRGEWRRVTQDDGTWLFDRKI